MSMKYSPGGSTFGLLPEPERSPVSFVISSTVNTAILVTFVLAGMMAKHVIQQRYEMTELVVPATPPSGTRLALTAAAISVYPTIVYLESILDADVFKGVTVHYAACTGSGQCVDARSFPQ